MHGGWIVLVRCEQLGRAVVSAGAKAAPLEALPIYFAVRLGRYLSGAGHLPEPGLVAAYLTVMEALADLAAGHATPSGVGLFPETLSVPVLVQQLSRELPASRTPPLHWKSNVFFISLWTPHTSALSFLLAPSSCVIAPRQPRASHCP